MHYILHCLLKKIIKIKKSFFFLVLETRSSKSMCQVWSLWSLTPGHAGALVGSSLCTYILDIFLCMLVCICVHVNVCTYMHMGVCVHSIIPSYMSRFPLSIFIERQMGWRPTVVTWLYLNHLLKALPVSKHSHILRCWGG